MRPRFSDQLPPPGPARVLVVLSMVVGGLVAIGLTALVLVFAFASLRG